MLYIRKSIKYGELQQQSSSQPILFVNLQLSWSILLQIETFWGDDSNQESFKECTKKFLEEKLLENWLDNAISCATIDQWWPINVLALFLCNYQG